MRARVKVTVTAVALCAMAGYGTGHAATQHRHPVAGDAPATGAGETAFIRAVLTDLRAPATAANVASVTDWIRHETPWPPVAADNPLDSTLPEPGSTAHNYLPGGGSVQDYRTAAEGAAATAATIANGRYPHVLADLRAGSGVCGDTETAAEFLTWSGNGYSAVC